MDISRTPALWREQPAHIPSEDQMTDPAQCVTPMSAPTITVKSSRPCLPAPPDPEVFPRIRQPRVRLDWNKYKTLITRLYLIDGYRLEDVRRAMSREHGFDASMSRYKKMLTAWSLRKNYTRVQKDRVIRDLSNDPRNQSELPLVNLRPLKKDRILRYLRAERKREAVDTATKYMLTTLRSSFSASTDSDSVEKALLLAGQYYSWYFSPSNWDHVDLTYSEPLHRVSDPILDARQYLRTDPRRSFQSLNEACANFQGLLRSQPFQLLPYLLAEFSRAVWRRARHLVETIFRFVAGMSKVTLGDQHPVSQILDLFHSDAALQCGASRVILFWMEAVIETYLGPSYRPYLQFVCSECLQTTTAFKVENDQKHVLGNQDLTLQYLLLRAKVTLAILYHGEGNPEGAEALWAEVINEAFGRERNNEIENEGITACYYLAWSCGDEEQCEELLGLGLRRAIRSPSHLDAYPQPAADPIDAALKGWQLSDPKVEKDSSWVWTLLEFISTQESQPVGQDRLCAEWKVCLLRRVEIWQAKEWA